MDSDHVGRLGWVDVEARRPNQIIAVSNEPVLDVGKPGTFDEFGITPLSVVCLPVGGLRLYYVGWQRGITTRYAMFSGAADSGDCGETFSRVSEAPILDRSDGELHTRAVGLVLPEQGGWRMWYSGGSEWQGSGDVARPRYALRHIRSRDGINWPRNGPICMEPRDDELGFGRPNIIERDGVLHMWYGRRAITSGAYRLGYATSSDGEHWSRDDEKAGLELGDAGSWDAEMVGMSSLLETPHGTYLFYNGNGYGATGFGVAVAEDL